MRAAVVDRYGGPEVIRIAEIPRPEPGADQVLVRVLAVAVTSGDARIRGARFPPGFGFLARLVFGLGRPRRRILGSAFSGLVEAVGSGSDRFAAGDPVCGMTGTRMGAHAQFIAIEAAKLARVPPGVTHEDAAGVLFGGTTALFFLRDKASVGPGMSVLVNGASGAIGTNAVQLARHLGARVTGVTSGAHAAMVVDLGAERVIDYTSEDLSTLGERFDVVLDAVGNLSIASGRRLLGPKGVLVLAVAGLRETLRARGDVVAGSARERVVDFKLLLGLVVDGTLTVVHDRTYDLDDIADAHRRVDSGHKVGNIVVHPRVSAEPRSLSP
jgi:NADPH:quinone reductase-like Zn-dependent oxidoreductase